MSVRIVGFLKINVKQGIADKTWCLHPGNENLSSRVNGIAETLNPHSFDFLQLWMPVTSATLQGAMQTVYAAGVKAPRGRDEWVYANGPQFWKARRLLIEAGLHPKMEVWFGRYRVDLLLRGLPVGKWKSFETSKRRVRLFGRIIGPNTPWACTRNRNRRLKS
jgi:hypothetical protein